METTLNMATTRLQDTESADSGPEQTVADWLLDAGKTYERSRDLLGALCARLVNEDVPIARMAVNIRVLHPQIATNGYVWRSGLTAAEQVDRSHDILDNDAYLKSPFRLIHQGKRMVRRRIAGPEADVEFPILEELRAKGVTDYVALPLTFSNGTINVITFAADRAGGFSEGCIDVFEKLLPPLAAVLEIQAMRRMAATLLDTYLGRQAGERVLAGEITRGGGITLRAVVWYSDLRRFTTMSDSMPQDDLIALLNDYFECMIGVIDDAGGEVLKLIGDGVLAIFPVGDAAGLGAVCDRAADAVQKAAAGMAARNSCCGADGKQPLDFGVALHLGDVIYGNIGAPDRLDFTVIGPAVNHVTRIEGLCKRTGRRLLVSSEFAENCQRPLEPLGAFDLRGVAEPQHVFALAEPVTVV